IARPSGNPMQAELLAVEAARAVAYARLAEQLHAVRVTSTTTVGGRIAEGQVVETRGDGLVRGAREAGRTVWREDGGGASAELTLRVCLTAASERCRGAATVVSVVVAEPAPVAPPVKVAPPVVAPPVVVVPPQPQPQPQPQPPVAGPATGLVISLGNLPFLPVLQPEVVAPDGSVVFAGAKVKRAVAANDGAAQYSGTLVDARKRRQAGTSPLEIKAIKLTDDNRIVVSEADAKRIRDANKAGGDFMSEGKVVIVMG
ncbi:MAG: hypothetical protein HY985_18225, partial [Magnetospirillum sp.]|nr:hypothetical protein [Magnetospirillum sp.]